jgi:serine/threonine protein phosphatase PrpC
MDPILSTRAASFVRAANHETCSDAVYCEAPLFAVADGVDHSDGSGQRALDEVLRLLDRTAANRDLRAALHAANWAAWYADPSTGRWRATVTIARLERDTIAIGHVGDSRAYLARAGLVEQLTDDQFAPSPHGRTRSTARLGARQTTAPVEMLRVRVRPGDKLLLCTDGLWRQIPAARLGDLLAGEVRAAAGRLFDLAAESGEDASAVLVELRDAHGAVRADHAPGRDEL